MEVEDRDLIAGYRRDGSVAALEQLVERHRAPLFGYIMNMTRDPNEADEVFQEVWLKVIRKIDGYRHRNFRGWLMRIAHNLVVDRARKRKPEVSLDDNREDSRPMADTLTNGDPGPGKKAEAAELGRRIADAVTTLPMEQKAVFLMRVEADLSFREIARIQRVSINTALARMHYALAKLRGQLRADFAEATGEASAHPAGKRGTT